MLHYSPNTGTQAPKLQKQSKAPSQALPVVTRCKTHKSSLLPKGRDSQDGSSRAFVQRLETLSMGLRQMTELVTLLEDLPCFGSQSSHSHRHFGLTHLNLPASLALIHPAAFLAFLWKGTDRPATILGPFCTRKGSAMVGTMVTPPHILLSPKSYIYEYIMRMDIHACMNICIYTQIYMCVYTQYVFILFLQEFSYYFLALQSLRSKEESRAIETQLFGS